MSTVEDFAKVQFLALTQKIGEKFDIPPKQIIVTSRNDRARLLAALEKSASGESKMVFPRAQLVLSSIRRNDTGYPARGMLHRGIHLGRTDDDSHVIRRHMIPITWAFNLYLQTDQFYEAIRLSSTALIESLRAGLSFSLEYESVALDFRVTSAADEVAVSEVDATVENPTSYFDLELPVELFGYTTTNLPDDMAHVPTIRQTIQDVSFINEG